MLKNVSVTCRVCHIEKDIKPKRRCAQNAHAKAPKKTQTCMECHGHLVHRDVPIRLTMPEERRARPGGPDEIASTGIEANLGPVPSIRTDLFCVRLGGVKANQMGEQMAAIRCI